MEEVEGRLYRPRSTVQSEEDAALAGVDDAAAGDAVLDPDLDPDLEPESLDLPESLDVDVSDDDDDDAAVSLDGVVLDDFDLPPRLSVL